VCTGNSRPLTPVVSLPFVTCRARWPTASGRSNKWYVGVLGTVLQSVPGFGPLTAALATALFAYAGPVPPAGTLCHRYYAFLYRQTPGQVPALNGSLSGRLNFNFPQWASAASCPSHPTILLHKVASAETRTATCAVMPSPSPAPAGSTVALMTLAIVAGVALVAGGAFWWWHAKQKHGNTDRQHALLGGK